MIAFISRPPKDTVKSNRAARTREPSGPAELIGARVGLSRLKTWLRGSDCRDLIRPIGQVVVGWPFTQCIHRPIVKQIYDRDANARVAVAVGREVRCMPVDLRVAAEDFRQGRLDQAERVCCGRASRMTRTTPTHSTSWGLVAIRRGDPREAVRLIGQAAALKPAEAAYQSNLGGAYRAVGEIDRAIASCQRAIELEPHYPDAHYNLALMLLARGEIDAAISHFREAIRQQPSFAAAHHGLGNALRQKGDRAGSLAHYQTAVALDPRSAEAQSNLGRALLEEGDHQQALVA